MAIQQTTSGAVRPKRKSNIRLEMLVRSLGQNLQISCAVGNASHLKAIWRNEIGPSLDPTPQRAT